MASFADAIQGAQDLGGAISWPTNWLPEEAGQTFLTGMPVQVASSDGGVQLWDGTTTTNGIAGISIQDAQNLGTTGAGAAAPPWGSISPGSNIGSYAANANQPSAQILPPGVPISIGLAGFLVAAPSTLFIAKIGTSASVTPVATANNQVGLAYGLTKDTGNNFWYVDTNKTSGSAVVRIYALAPLEAVGTVGGHVIFYFLPGAAQQQA